MILRKLGRFYIFSYFYINIFILFVIVFIRRVPRLRHIASTFLANSFLIYKYTKHFGRFMFSKSN